MMAALMATTALVARGASNEEVRSVRLFHFKGILRLANMGYILSTLPEMMISKDRKFSNDILLR
jgi:hypothetical protein